MKINICQEQNSILKNFIAQLRDCHIQKDKMRFRINLERIGEILGYEISKTMEFQDISVKTPLGISETQIVKDNPVLGTVLRAGLPLHQGLQNIFDNSDNAYISAYRKYDELHHNFTIKFEYIASPSFENRVVIISDPMLATGASLLTAYQAILHRGTPKHLHFVTVIASQIGIDYLKENIKEENVTLWVVTLDKELNDHGYIIPGLGDAGDLALGEKL